MSTRAYIGYKNKKKDDFKAVYSHFDGYPTGLGKQIWKVLHEKFINNEGRLGVMNDKNVENALESFCRIYIDGHKGGWSSFDSECYCHSADFVMRDGGSEDKKLATSANLKDSWVEWVYIIDPIKQQMEVFSLYENRETKYPKIKKAIVSLAINALEPDWGKIESGDWEQSSQGVKEEKKIEGELPHSN